MTRAQLDEIRALLEKAKRELAERDAVSRQSAKVEKLDKCAVGRESRMELMQSREMAMESERRRQQKLKQTDAALQRITSGSYGNCAACGEEIDFHRLRLDPAVSHCIKCAQA